MILKVRSTTKDYEWHYVDGIRRIAVTVTLKDTVEHFVQEVRRVTDIFIIAPLHFHIPESEETLAGQFFQNTKKNVTNHTELESPIDPERILSYRMADCVGENGEDFCIYFDGDAFLLNDKGTTVDRFFIERDVKR